MKNPNDFTVTEKGEAFISQRKAAELCGVDVTAINDFYHSNNIDVKQGVNHRSLEKPIAYYAMEGRPEAIQTLILFAKAGVKAYMYREAGVLLKTFKPTQPLLVSDKRETFELLKLIAEEFNVKGVDKIIMFEKGLTLYPDLQNALPTPKFTGTVGEVSKRVAHSYSYHKKALNLRLSSGSFNKEMLKWGYLEEKHTSNGNPYKSITEKGLIYGKNVVPRQATTITQTHWYDDTILNLYEEIS